MMRLSHAVLTGLSFTCISTAARAGWFSVEATVARSGSASQPFTETQVSTSDTVAVGVSHDWLNPQGQSVGLMANAETVSERGRVSSTLNAQTLGGAAIWSIGAATARADDIVITSRDGLHNGEQITFSVMVTPTLEANLSCSSPSQWDRMFVYADLTWSARLDSSLGTHYIERRTLMNLHWGQGGDPVGQSSVIQVSAIVGQAFSLDISGRCEIGAMGGVRNVNGGWVYERGNSSATWALQVGGAGASFAPQPFLILPEGFTANSTDFGVSDNFLSVPAPSAAALLLAAGTLRRRRAA